MNKTWEKYFAEQMTQEQYYKWNEQMCDELIEQQKSEPCLTS
jgi:hypothetical protein